MLKDYGYYYPNYDVAKGAEQFKNILMNHDREKYIKKHKKILDKFSINNRQFHSWVHSRLDEIDDLDCMT